MRSRRVIGRTRFVSAYRSPIPAEATSNWAAGGQATQQAQRFERRVLQSEVEDPEAFRPPDD